VVFHLFSKIIFGNLNPEAGAIKRDDPLPLYGIPEIIPKKH
jgi:hypothetical protein